MKKIIIFSVLFLFGLFGCAFAGCPISELDACKADIGSGINTHIQDKVLPNNLDKLIKPQNTMESRSQLGQPQVPENINMEPTDGKFLTQFGVKNSNSLIRLRLFY